MATISQGLKDGAFFWSLVKKPLRRYDELLSRAKKYVNVKEAQKARQGIDPWPSRENCCPSAGATQVRGFQIIHDGALPRKALRSDGS